MFPLLIPASVVLTVGLLACLSILTWQGWRAWAYFEEPDWSLPVSFSLVFGVASAAFFLVRLA